MTGRMVVVLGALSAIDRHIDLISNDLHCFEDGAYVGSLTSSEYMGAALFERELYLTEIRELR